MAMVGRGTVRAISGTSIALAVIVVVAASTAFACTNIATINLSDSQGRPGRTVMVTGSSFGAIKRSSTAPPVPIKVRWDGSEGPVLAEAMADTFGQFSVQITIPDVAPGRYVVLAVQRDVDGYDIYGSPARAAFAVVTPEGKAVNQPVTALGPEPSGSDLIPGMVALFAAGLAGLGLFVGGVATALKQGGRPERAPAPVTTAGP